MEISQEIQTLTEIIQRVFNSSHGTTIPTRTPRFISWEPLEMDQVALNIDESVTDTTVGVGGIIQSHDGRWIMRFCSHTTSREILEVELLAIFEGLRLCWEMNLRAIRCMTDSSLAMQYITRGVPQFHRYVVLVK
ncbi:Ribonuclease H-like superfamily [Sesbania bispinosa]|nr:Ribonuclease H-like superfamily [Sesbania bispinosa]